MSNSTVLSIDDDQNLQLVISQYLESEGYNVLTAHNAAEALEMAQNNNINVILLDLVLENGEQGLNLIPQLQAGSKAAIIVVSGKSDTTEKVVCLEMGADDYITKPFEMRELSARIKVALRRSQAKMNQPQSQTAPEEKIYFSDGWCLDRTQYQLFNNKNESANLTTGEFKLLEALVTAPNRAISRERLFELTRDGEYDAYDRAIDIQIGRLRKKLGQNGDGEEIIKTVRGVGYMFIGHVDKAA